MRIIAFFNNKGGVGKTSLVYHLAWMYSDLGLRVLTADLDPQANLTSMFIEESGLERLWPSDGRARTVLGAIHPLIQGTGDVELCHIEEIGDRLGLIVGDLGLAQFEDELGTTWAGCADGKERAFRVTSAFHRLLIEAGEQQGADLILVDVGPNLGALNRAVLIAAQFVVIPLIPDLFSLQGLRNLGPTLRQWQSQWKVRKGNNPDATLRLPAGEMTPVGYVVHQHAVRLDRPVKAYAKWMSRIPGTYAEEILQQRDCIPARPDEDAHCLASLKHYRSLMPMAQEARKPIFHLKPIDGALGGHANAVRECNQEFQQLASRIADQCAIKMA